MKVTAYGVLLLLILIPTVSLGAGYSMSVPEGYVSTEVGPCRVAVPERNKALLNELGSTCRQTQGRIFRQLGLSSADSFGLVDIRIVGDPQDMGEVAPPGAEPPIWSGAVAYPDVDLVILALRNHVGSPVTDLDVVLEHEISHLALRKAIGGAKVPRWFSEGIAIQQSELSSIRRYWLVWLAGRSDELLSLESIERYPDHTGQINLAYAEAADFLGFLLRREGWVGMRIAVRKLADGMAFDEAFEFAFRDSIASLEEEWRDGLRSRWQWLPLITGTGAVWGFIVILFLVAYAVAKRRHIRRLAEMEEEEDLLGRLIDPAQPSLRPSLSVHGKSRTVTKIRVDDEIHTLH